SAVLLRRLDVLTTHGLALVRSGNLPWDDLRRQVNDLKSLGGGTEAAEQSRWLHLLQVRTTATDQTGTQPTEEELRNLLSMLRVNGLPLLKDNKLPLSDYLNRLNEIMVHGSVAPPGWLRDRIEIAKLQARLAASKLEPLTVNQLIEGMRLMSTAGKRLLLEDFIPYAE